MNTYCHQSFELDDTHQSFLGEEISFRLYEFIPDINTVIAQAQVLENAKTFYAIEAFVNKKAAGYILLGYIDETYAAQFFPTVLDWYIHRFMDNATKKQWLEQDKEALRAVASRLEVSDIEWENNDNLAQRLIEKLSQGRYFAAYKSFQSYWVGKPNVEYSCVYGHQDKLRKDFSSYPFTHVSRESLHFRSQGIAQKLYEVAANYLKNKKLYIYASTTQTEDGKKMWRIMENHPRFTILSEVLYTTQTTQRDVLVNQTRFKMTTQ